MRAPPWPVATDAFLPRERWMTQTMTLRRPAHLPERSSHAHPEHSGPDRFFHPGRARPGPGGDARRHPWRAAARPVCLRNAAAATGRSGGSVGTARAPTGAAPWCASDCGDRHGSAAGRLPGRGRASRSAGGARTHAPSLARAALAHAAVPVVAPLSLPGAGGMSSAAGALCTGPGGGGFLCGIAPTGALRGRFRDRRGPGTVPCHRHPR